MTTIAWHQDWDKNTEFWHYVISVHNLQDITSTQEAYLTTLCNSHWQASRHLATWLLFIRCHIDHSSVLCFDVQGFLIFLSMCEYCIVGDIQIGLGDWIFCSTYNATSTSCLVPILVSIYKYLGLTSVSGEHFLHLSNILLITGRTSAKRFWNSGTKEGILNLYWSKIS